MKVGLQTWGTTGDVQTMIALGHGLRAVGHEVVDLVATSVENKDYSELCHNVGLRYTKVPEHVSVDFEGMSRELNGRNNAQVIVKYLIFPFAEAMFQAAVRLCETSDVVIGHSRLYPLKAAAALTGKPFVSVTFWPGELPTEYLPPEGLAPGMKHAQAMLARLGGERARRALNRFAWRQCQGEFDGMLKDTIARFWAKAGLPPFNHVLPDAWFSERLNLMPVSPELWPRPSDWSENHRLSGYLSLPGSAEKYSPPPSLQAFLQAGPPPVFMTLGSMADYLAAERIVKRFADAARLARCRAIIQAHHGIPPEEAWREDLYFIGRVPHDQLFPHCAAVVHHGGAGTTHAAAQCGRPAVVVGFSDEMFSWGNALRRAGVGGEPLRAMTTATFEQDVSPARLARSIRSVLDSPAIQQRAQVVGQRMRQEDGVARAVEYIEEMMRHLTRV